MDFSGLSYTTLCSCEEMVSALWTSHGEPTLSSGTTRLASPPHREQKAVTLQKNNKEEENQIE